MWQQSRILLFAGGFTLGLATNGMAGEVAPKFTSIDHPGAAATEANGIITTRGPILIVGDYGDSTGEHGYLMSDGTFIMSINFPQAVITQAYSINAGGDIVGNYSLTGPNDLHGYMLRGGTFTALDFPGAVQTSARGINTAGNIVGWYDTSAGTFPQRHGFLLSGVGGVFSSIDFPGAIETEAWRINDQGEVVGRFKSLADGKNHMYQFTSSGGFTTIADFPGGVRTAAEPGEISGGGINSAGDITGDYCSSDPCHVNIGAGFSVDTNIAGSVHGFMLRAGVYTTIDFPGGIATTAYAIDNGGDIVGAWVDSGGRIHGYLRTCQISALTPTCE